MTTSFYISDFQTLVCRTVTRRACGKVKVIHSSFTDALPGGGRLKGIAEEEERGRERREGGKRERHEWVREGRRRERGREMNICEKDSCLHLNVL